MRTLDIRRHSFTKKGDARGRGSHLSHEGVVAARELGGSLDNYDLVVASTSPRTLETAVAMGFAVDDLIEMPSPVETGEVEFHAWREWEDPFTTLLALGRESAAVDGYLEEQATRVVSTLARLGDAGSALVVGHGGWIESVVARLVGPSEASSLGGSFWHLDGMSLRIDENGTASVSAIHRHPR